MFLAICFFWFLWILSFPKRLKRSVSCRVFRFVSGFSFSIWSCLVRRKKETREKKKTKTSDRYIFLPRDSGTVLTFLLCLVFVWCFFPLFFNVIVTQMQSCWAINIIKLNVILCFHMRFSGSLARRRFKKRSFFFLSFYFEK